VPTLTTRATSSSGSTLTGDQGDDHGRDRLTLLTLPTLAEIDGGGLVLMTRASTPTAYVDAVQLLTASSSRPRRHY